MTLEEMIEERAVKILQHAKKHGDGRGWSPGWDKEAAREELESEWCKRNADAVKALIEGRAGVFEIADWDTKGAGIRIDENSWINMNQNVRLDTQGSGG